MTLVRSFRSLLCALALQSLVGAVAGAQVTQAEYAARRDALAKSPPEG